MGRFANVGVALLRGWVFITGMAGLGSGVSAFLKPESANIVYENIPYSPAFSRMYGTWLLLSTMVRVLFALEPYNGGLFVAVLWTYCVALYHFSLEIFVHRTVPLQPAGQMPLTVASGSIVALVAFAATTRLRRPSSPSSPPPPSSHAGDKKGQ